MKFINNVEKWVTRKIFGRLRGTEYLLKRGKIDMSCFYDMLTKYIIEDILRPDSVCIDVGCCIGAILQHMIKNAPSGTLLAFEPIPKLYKNLVKNFRYENVHIYNLALSDSKGISTFNYVISNPGYSGLKKRRYDRPDERDMQIEVKTDTLDNILAKERIKKVDLIKIDVEGAEYLVMKGAERCIRENKPVIIFEHGLVGCQCYEMIPEDIYQFLNDNCKMRIYLLSDWLQGKPNLNITRFSEQIYEQKNHLFIAHE